MTSQGLTRRALIGAALAIPAIHAAKADCKTPALRIRVRKNFRSFNPADAAREDAIVTRNLLAPLVRYKRHGTGNAWDWERHIVDSITNDDPRTYRLTLREERWQGTSSVSTEDVAHSFERIIGRSGHLREGGKTGQSAPLLQQAAADDPHCRGLRHAADLRP